MSIQTELSRIVNAKAAIKAAIEGKGVTVPDATLLDGMASLIESIEAGGSGGMKVEVFSITPADEMLAGTYEIGETTITNPHFCVCFDGTHPASNNTDTKKYHGLMTYVGCDATLWGEIGSAYNKPNFGLAYTKDVSLYSYRRYDYGSFISFNLSYSGNGFYVQNGKLYNNSERISSSKWMFEAGHTYYILLIGE